MTIHPNVKPRNSRPRQGRGVLLTPGADQAWVAVATGVCNGADVRQPRERFLRDVSNPGASSADQGAL